VGRERRRPIEGEELISGTTRFRSTAKETLIESQSLGEDLIGAGNRSMQGVERGQELVITKLLDAQAQTDGEGGGRAQASFESGRLSMLAIRAAVGGGKPGGNMLQVETKEAFGGFPAGVRVEIRWESGNRRSEVPGDFGTQPVVISQKRHIELEHTRPNMSSSVDCQAKHHWEVS
jgi:hypothetical protein